jgi:hypothetical protein
MGRAESPNLKTITSEPGLDKALFIESEMALFSECSLECASKLLDTADIVREAIYQQSSRSIHQRAV